MATSSRTRRHHSFPCAATHRNPSVDSYHSRVRLMSLVWSMGTSAWNRTLTSDFNGCTHRGAQAITLLNGPRFCARPRRALAAARIHRAKPGRLPAIGLARIWRDHGKRPQAHDLLAVIFGWLTEGFDPLETG